MELFQPSFTLSTRHCMCVLPRIAKTSADGTMSCAMSRITLVSFLSCILSHVALKRSSRNKVSGGYVCSWSSRLLQHSWLAFVTPEEDDFNNTPLVARTVVYCGFLYSALFCSLEFCSPWFVELGVAESVSEFFLLLDETDLLRASMFSMSLPFAMYCSGQCLFAAQYATGCSSSMVRSIVEHGTGL